MAYTIFRFRMEATNNASPTGIDIGHKLALNQTSETLYENEYIGQKPNIPKDNKSTIVKGAKIFKTSFQPPKRQASTSQNGATAIPTWGLMEMKNNPNCGGRMKPREASQSMLPLRSMCITSGESNKNTMAIGFALRRCAMNVYDINPQKISNTLPTASGSKAGRASIISVQGA